MSRCTWKGCALEATHPQLDRNGKEWAKLCQAHHDELDRSIGGEVKVMMRCWVLAQGGSQAAAKRMLTP